MKELRFFVKIHVSQPLLHLLHERGIHFATLLISLDVSNTRACFKIDCLSGQSWEACHRGLPLNPCNVDICQSSLSRLKIFMIVIIILIIELDNVIMIYCHHKVGKISTSSKTNSSLSLKRIIKDWDEVIIMNTNGKVEYFWNQ